MNTLERDITIALNAHSAENGSNTPDFILAKLLVGTLNSFNQAMKSSATGEVDATVTEYLKESLDNLNDALTERNTWYSLMAAAGTTEVLINVGETGTRLIGYELAAFNASASIGSAP